MRRLLLVLCLLGLVACSDDGRDDASITVLAASSLTDALTEIAEAFDGEVTLSFGGSSSLRAQIAAGSPADVFASADSDDDGAAFATNGLVIVVPAGNGADVNGLDDFSNDGLLLGLCAEEVPCGRYAREALDRAGVTPSVDTEEPDVRSLLGKVESGELDAGIVYRTDVLAAGDAVEGVRLPKEHDVVVTYPIDALTEDGDAFVDLVLSAEGRAILADHGFGPPSP
ncbi:MAG TPA: molybdate ABC transporter substrate-binding protein [Acidimicrobiales bacterium]|nr:molybdate ABC transporter substrate-binding protein [Acidimicrobiales bacterium]